MNRAAQPGPQSVVVGVDGSLSALVAVGWAAREAARRGARLRIVEVVRFQADASEQPAAVAAADAARAARTDAAAEHLALAAEHVAAFLPADRVELAVRHGEPAEVLGDASETAALLVLGGPRGGWVGSLLALALAGRARCPLVLVERFGRPRRDAPVVVGIDGSADGDAALAAAFREAHDRGAPLEIVHAWSDEPLDAVRTVDFAAFAAEVRRTVDARVAPLRPVFGDVRIRHTIVRDHPDHALAEASRGAHVVVLGARGRSSSPAIGQVGRAVVLLAECPVLIVGPGCRPARAGAAGDEPALLTP